MHENHLAFMPSAKIEPNYKRILLSDLERIEAAIPSLPINIRLL